MQRLRILLLANSDSRLRRAKIQRGAHSKDGCIANRARAACVRYVSTWLDDILKVWLQGPTRLNLRRVTDLEKCLVIAHHRQPRIDVKAVDLIGDAGIGEPNGKRVVGPMRHHAGESDAALGIEIHQIASTSPNRYLADDPACQSLRSACRRCRSVGVQSYQNGSNLRVGWCRQGPASDCTCRSPP